MTLPIKSTPENRKLIFNSIKAKILKHLEELEKEETSEIKKTFSELTGLLLKGGKGLPVGTIREWKGKKFIKVAPGKWKPKYDSETRGAKLAISALKKKISQCEDEREMMALVLENRDRFSDKNGNPLPFVQQLSDFISQTQDKKKEPHLRAFETEYKKTKEWYANAKATSTEIDDLEQEIRSLDRKIKSVKKQGMGDTNPTLAGWYGCQNAQKETLNELKAAKEAGFETLKEYKNAKNSDGSGRGEPSDDGYPEKDYPEYRGKGQEAVDFIVKQKGGQVKGAFNRPEIGDIDVVWGKITDKEKHTGYGLSHIIDKHGMDAVNKIGEVIKTGDVIHPKNNPERIAIESNNFHVGLRQQWGGKKKTWIITGFEKEGNAKTTRSNKDYTGETLPETSTTSIPQSEEKSSLFELDNNKKDKTAADVPEYAYKDVLESVNHRSFEDAVSFLKERVAEFSESIEKYSFYKDDSKYIDKLNAYKKVLAEFTTDKSIWAKTHIERKKKDIALNNERIEDWKKDIESYKKKLLEVEKAPSDSRFKFPKEKTLHTKQYTIKYYKEAIDRCNSDIKESEERNAKFKKEIKSAETIIDQKPHLTKSILWLQNYLSKNGQKEESAIEVLRKRLEKERRV